MEIRARSGGDIDGLVAPAKRVREIDDYPDHLPTDDYVGFLERPTPFRAWVAVDGSQIVGHVALNETTSSAAMELVADAPRNGRPIYVARLMVNPACRKRGTGGRLLDCASSAAFELGRHPFLDVVDIATRRPAIELYRHSGWEEVGQVDVQLGDRVVRELVFRSPPRLSDGRQSGARSAR